MKLYYNINNYKYIPDRRKKLKMINSWKLLIRIIKLKKILSCLK